MFLRADTMLHTADTIFAVACDFYDSEGRGEVDLRTTRKTRNAAAYATIVVAQRRPITVPCYWRVFHIGAKTSAIAR